MRPKLLALTMVIVLSFLAGTLIPTARTQSGPTSQYVMVNYMKVDPGREDAYVRIEREIWKPFHQQRVKDGKMRSWSLFEVRFPGGDNREYAYLTVETYNNIQDAEGSYDDKDAMTSLLKKTHPDKAVDQYIVQTINSRRLVRSEVLKLVDRTN